MNLVYERCAGLDVHKRTVVACVIIPGASGQRHKERQTFSTVTSDLLRLRECLTALWIAERRGALCNVIVTLMVDKAS